MTEGMCSFPLSETTSHSTRLPKTAAKSLVIPQAGEGLRVRDFEQISHFQKLIDPHPQPFSRLREKGA